MPQFELPSRPAGFEANYFRLTVLGQFDLSAEEFEAFAASIGFDGEDFHARLDESEEDSDWGSIAFSGLIGIHKSSADENGVGERYWLHYSVDFLRDVGSKPSTSPKWQVAFTALAMELPRHAATVRFFAELRSESVVFAIDTPIPLAPSEVPGFSEIRGVRLVKTDPDEPDTELYSIVLDRPGRAATVQIQADVEANLNHEVLATGFDRAMTVMNLAVAYASA